MTSDSEAMLLRPSYLACADRLRREARLCDITLYVPGRTGAMVGYTAHRVMLVAASKYFKHLFERDELHKTCYLLHLTEDGLSVVLDVVYGRGINSQMNLADALVAARFLQVDGATELLERNRDQMKSSSSPSSKRKRRLSGGSHSWSNSQTHPPAEPSGGFCQKQSESDTLVQRPVLLFQNLQSKYEGPISKEKEEVWNQDSGNQDMLPRHNDSTLMETGHKDVGDTDTYTDVLSGAVSVKNEPFRDVETAADNHEIGFAHTDSFPQQTFATRGADVASGVCSFEASHDDDMPAFSVSDHGQQIRYECDICDCEFSKAAALREHHALHKGGCRLMYGVCAFSLDNLQLLFVKAYFMSLLKGFYRIDGWLIGWLCFMSHRQQGHFETAAPFTVPCEGCEARFIHRSHRESNPGPSHGSPLHYHCAML